MCYENGTENATCSEFKSVLMVVDILLYDIARVPVGDDQRQHLELTRTIAQRFNGRYGPTFVLPEAVIPPVAVRVRDLPDPSRKMSASSEPSAGVIDVLDPLDVVARKIRRAVTDPEAEVRSWVPARARRQWTWPGSTTELR